MVNADNNTGSSCDDLVGCSQGNEDRSPSSHTALLDENDENGDMRSGFIKLHRKIFDHPRSTDPEYVSIWLWMLCEATYKEKTAIFAGKEIKLKPGQFTAGRHQIAAATGVKENKVRRVIEWMKTSHQIEQQTTNKYSLFTVLKWAEYQFEEKSDQQNSQQDASKQPTTRQQPATPEEGKKVKKEKKINIEPEGFLEMWEKAKEFLSSKDDSAKKRNTRSSVLGTVKKLVAEGISCDTAYNYWIYKNGGLPFDRCFSFNQKNLPPMDLHEWLETSREPEDNFHEKQQQKKQQQLLKEKA